MIAIQLDLFKTKEECEIEELERLIFIVSGVLNNNMLPHEITDELEPIIEGSQFTNFQSSIPLAPIPWNFKFEMFINPESIETSDVIRNAMRSAEVNENIKKRFNAIVREEVNWYIDRVKYFMVKGDTNILE